MAYSGQLSFSNEEIQKHKSTANEINSIASGMLISIREDHIKFYESHCKQYKGKKVCISKYYGDRKYTTNPNGDTLPNGTKLEYIGDDLKEIGFGEEIIKKLERISCIGLATDCLSAAFLKTGQAGQWKKIRDFYVENGRTGVALQEGLSRIGWTTYYWNPAPKNTIVADMDKWDIQEAKWASRGYHAQRYKSVMENKKYWFNDVDDSTSLVSFGFSIPGLMSQLPFWVGSAHTSYHVFPGTYADVVEAHSTRHITSIDNIEFSKFSPLANGGGPRWTSVEKYRSGIIVALRP